MKSLFLCTVIILATLVGFASCSSNKSVSTKDLSVASDTVRIANDSLEYEIIIIEPGFNAWLVTQRPKGYYGQTFLEGKNRLFVTEYNRRVRNFQQFDANLYQQEINYNFGTDYGLEVNYHLYNYFIYFQERFGQSFTGGRQIRR